MLTLSILEIHFIGPIVEFHTPDGKRKGDAQRIKIPIPECTIIIVIYTYANSPFIIGRTSNIVVLSKDHK